MAYTVHGALHLSGDDGLIHVRFAGRKSTIGAPTTGSWSAGDTVLDSLGVWHLCVADGSPGTWVSQQPPAQVFEREFYATGDAEVTTGTMRRYNDTGKTLTVQSIRASVGTAPTGSPLTVELQRNGSTTLATVSIVAGANTQIETPANQTVAGGDYLTVDVTAVGSSTAGADLQVSVVLA